MILTEANYFGQEAAEQYMSASQIKRFLTCEALALAEIRGEYQRESTQALMVGSYVDYFFSGNLEQFIAENPNIHTQRGTLRAEYQQANEIIDYIQADPLLMMMLDGEQQKIVTGQICGVPFRGKLDGLLSAEQCRAIAEKYPQLAEDLLMADGAIVDLKIVKDFNKIWKLGKGYVGFIENWGYDLQLAVYQKLVGGRLPCFIVAATKEKTPDKALIRIPQYMLSAALIALADDIPRFQHLKQHPEEARRCEKCEYCRLTKIITGAVDADEIGEDEQ